MLRIPLLLILLISLSQAWAQGSYPGSLDGTEGIDGYNFYSDNELWGIQSKRSRPVTPALYDTLIHVGNGQVMAKKWVTSEQQSLWGALNSEGKQIIGFQYLSLEAHNNNFICSSLQYNLVKFGLLDTEGRIIVNSDYDKIIWVGPNRFAATKGKKTSIIDHLGNRTTQLAADSLERQGPRLLQVWLSGKTGLVTTEGDPVTDIKFANLVSSQNTIEALSFSKWLIVDEQDSAYYQFDNMKVWSNVYIVGNNQKQWLIDKSDSTLSTAYDHIIPLNDQLALIESNGYYGAVDHTGGEVLAPKFDSLIYQKGYFLAAKGKYKLVWSLIDRFGVVKTSFGYDQILKSSEGLFRMQKKYKWGFIDRFGVEVIPAVFDQVEAFNKGRTKVIYLGEQGVIDNKGAWLIKPKNEQITWIGDDRYLGTSYRLSFLKTFDNEYIYFTSNELIPGNGLILELDSNRQIINRISMSGTFVYRSQNYTPQYGEGEGLAIIKNNRKYGMVDKNGNLVIANRYDSLRPFSEGLAAMKINDKWGFIDKMEILVVQPQFESVSDFYNEQSRIVQSGKVGVINQKGEVIIKPTYDDIVLTSEGLYLVEINNKFGLLNRSGAAIVHPRYDALKLIDNGDMIAQRNGKYGIIASSGVNLTSKSYEYIDYNKKSRSLLFKQPASLPQLVYYFK